MAKKKTKSGFEYKLSPERLNNYELLEAVGEIDQNPFAISKVLNLLLGKDEINQLKEHLRTEDGIVPLDKLEDEITEMFQSHDESKNY